MNEYKAGQIGPYLQTDLSCICYTSPVSAEYSAVLSAACLSNLMVMPVPPAPNKPSLPCAADAAASLPLSCHHQQQQQRFDQLAGEGNGQKKGVASTRWNCCGLQTTAASIAHSGCMHLSMVHAVCRPGSVCQICHSLLCTRCATACCDQPVLMLLSTCVCR